MNNLRGVLYAVVSSATFGLIPLFSIPLLQGGMSSPAILFYRFGLAAAMMGLIALATRRPLRITWPQTGTLLLLGAMYSVTALGLLRSYTYIPSSVATTINFLYPLGVAIVMTLFFREKNSVWLLVAILIYEGENETYIEASAENSGSILYDKEIRDKPRTRRTKRNV